MDDDDMSVPLVSLHPPSHGDVDLADAARPDWILLDFRAYVNSCTNATTASCKTRDGLSDIQLTFFPAQPPRVSHFCVHRSGLGPNCFADEPNIIATDGKFVLLRIFMGYRGSILRPDLHEYYIYCADGGPDGGASLQLLPNPRPYNQEDDEGFIHETTKVITVGGEHVTIAFVDLWRGILLYDVFREVPVLRYVPLPVMFRPATTPRGTPSVTRDIALVDGSIRFVHTVMKIESVSRVFGDYVSGGWVASKWSMEAPFDEDSDWTEDCTIDASEISAAPLEMLLKELPEREGKPRVTLETLHIGHPTLNLDDGDIVYFMAKVMQQEKKAWILAVDMNQRMLLRYSEFGAERTFGLSYTYTQSRISKYLNMTPDLEGEELYNFDEDDA